MVADEACAANASRPPLIYLHSARNLRGSAKIHYGRQSQYPRHRYESKAERTADVRPSNHEIRRRTEELGAESLNSESHRVDSEKPRRMFEKLSDIGFMQLTHTYGNAFTQFNRANSYVNFQYRECDDLQ